MVLQFSLRIPVRPILQEDHCLSRDNASPGATVNRVLFCAEIHSWPCWKRRVVLCQDDAQASCCMEDEGGPLERPTRPQIWKRESPFSVNCLYRTDSISSACGGDEARSAWK